MPFLNSGEWWLVVVSFMTSLFTAVAGMGGGMLLLALMPGLIPVGAIIPMHGAVQLVSNGSRAGFSRETIRWDILKQYLPGAMVGTMLGAFLFRALDTMFVPILMGAVILLITWLPLHHLNFLFKWFLTFSVTHSLLSSVAGAAGPMAGAFLSRMKLSRDALVTTLAGIMSISHILKIVAFGVTGFSFGDYWQLILCMMVSVMAGSFVGSKLRPLIPEVSFKKGFRMFISLLAVRMLLMPLFM